ncbi:uncharacterized protein LOC101864096, partial [Aplysia californica]|uniref:Uncharacterized protein LOC101864096 n=1 Tax=Aplysia californica TaxID=6500 RepID=A0ABM1AAD0_APLCA
MQLPCPGKHSTFGVLLLTTLSFYIYASLNGWTNVVFSRNNRLGFSKNVTGVYLQGSAPTRKGNLTNGHQASSSPTSSPLGRSTPTPESSPTPSLPQDVASSFHRVPGENIWVYSVFYEPFKAELGGPGVRGIGLAPVKNEASVYCHVTFVDGSRTIVRSNIVRSRDSHGLRFSAVHLECRVPANTRPKHVAFARAQNGTVGEQFPVLYPGTERVREFTVCYATLFN